jgi:hypothetical protein
MAMPISMSGIVALQPAAGPLFDDEALAPRLAFGVTHCLA